MSIRRAHLIPDTLRPSADGITGTQIGAVVVDGENHRAYIKALPAEACAAEAYCALLLQHWGLSVPEPVWIEHDGAVLFGSLDAEYPSLKQRFQLGHPWPGAVAQKLAAVVAAIVSAFPSAGLACAADEAIANTDRNFGNILWDGGDPSWIDHERTLGLADGDVNKLADMAVLAGKAADVQRSAIAAALTLARDVLQDIEGHVPVDASKFTALVTARLARIGNLVDARFPAPKHDLFSR
ncbi:MAG: hypothetical protein JNK52_16485 [Zoogloeaceae bacterium]|nr:hypothetical protein [Zoogloeaceae bacterium]